MLLTNTDQLAILGPQHPGWLIAANKAGIMKMALEYTIVMRVITATKRPGTSAREKRPAGREPLRFGTPKVEAGRTGKYNTSRTRVRD